MCCFVRSLLCEREYLRVFRAENRWCEALSCFSKVLAALRGFKEETRIISENVKFFDLMSRIAHFYRWLATCPLFFDRRTAILSHWVLENHEKMDWPWSDLCSYHEALLETERILKDKEATRVILMCPQHRNHIDSYNIDCNWRTKSWCIVSQHAQIFVHRSRATGECFAPHLTLRLEEQVLQVHLSV